MSDTDEPIHARIERGYQSRTVKVVTMFRAHSNAGAPVMATYVTSCGSRYTASLRCFDFTADMSGRFAPCGHAL